MVIGEISLRTRFVGEGILVAIRETDPNEFPGFVNYGGYVFGVQVGIRGNRNNGTGTDLGAPHHEPGLKSVG